ncbi:hypothetical protein FRC03_011739 [Tulasnella sp. 419]|nr:hypothetical protein FRC03_011739 [Tulasnella sp. 419]
MAEASRGKPQQLTAIEYYNVLLLQIIVVGQGEKSGCLIKESSDSPCCFVLSLREFCSLSQSTRLQSQLKSKELQYATSDEKRVWNNETVDCEMSVESSNETSKLQ